MILLLVLCFCKEAVTMASSKAIEGYPNGYMADCPGSTKPAIITKKSLRQLAFVNANFNGSDRRYNYYEMNELANDLQFDFNRTTVVYVSGFLDSAHFLASRLVAEAFSNLGYNILALDTNKFTTFDYQIASRLSRPVGKHTAEMLADLTRLGLNPKKIHLVGLSLGGQTVSFIAKHYKNLTGYKISRVTGLDPAGPCFRNLGSNERIDSSDADFVDIISTNIDGFGMAAPVAHVQFYVNGGEFQPAGPILWYNCGIICSHVYAMMIWLSAIRNPKSFIGMQCDSIQQARDNDCYDRYPLVTNVMGLETDRKRRGIFYLATEQYPPYFLGAKGLKKKYNFVLKNLRAVNDIDMYII